MDTKTDTKFPKVTADNGNMANARFLPYDRDAKFSEALGPSCAMQALNRSNFRPNPPPSMRSWNVVYGFCIWDAIFRAKRSQQRLTLKSRKSL
jgi:hypothetical protein